MSLIGITILTGVLIIGIGLSSLVYSETEVMCELDD